MAGDALSCKFQRQSWPSFTVSPRPWQADFFGELRERRRIKPVFLSSTLAASLSSVSPGRTVPWPGQDRPLIPLRSPDAPCSRRSCPQPQGRWHGYPARGTPAQARVNIQHPPGPAPHQIGRQQAHIPARQDDLDPGVRPTASIARSCAARSFAERLGRHRLRSTPSPRQSPAAPHLGLFATTSAISAGYSAPCAAFIAPPYRSRARKSGSQHAA